MGWPPTSVTDQTDFSVVYFMSHKVHKPAATTSAGPNTEHSLSLWLYKKHVVKWKQNEEDRVLRLFFSVSEKIPILSYQTTLKSKHTRARARTRVTHIYIFTDKPMDAISIWELPVFCLNFYIVTSVFISYHFFGSYLFFKLLVFFLHTLDCGNG